LIFWQRGEDNERAGAVVVKGRPTHLTVGSILRRHPDMFAHEVNIHGLAIFLLNVRDSLTGSGMET
jgi:hypothetical protein